MKSRLVQRHRLLNSVAETKEITIFEIIWQKCEEKTYCQS